MKYSFTNNPFKVGDLIRSVPLFFGTEHKIFIMSLEGLSVEAELGRRNFLWWDEVVGYSKVPTDLNDDEWE